MDAAHRRALMKNARLLSKDLVVDEELLSVFEAKGIFTPTNTEEIKSKGSSSGMSSAFRSLLPMRGPKAFPTFIEALVETEQDHIAQTLDPALATKHIGDRDNPEGMSKEDTPDPPKGEPSCAPKTSAQETGFTEDTGDSFIKVKIPDVDKDTAARILGDCKNVYPIKSQRRGRAIILNNNYFANLRERDGSDLDATNLDSLFKALGFEVDTWGNLTSREIMHKIGKECNEEAHENADAFIFAILSHGDQVHIFDTNDEKVKLEEIFTKFDDKNFPKLAGKPKIFFIQAFTRDIGDDADALKEGGGQDKLDALRSEQSTPDPITWEKPDFVLVYATARDYQPWSKTRGRIWFIPDLIKTFMERCHKDHLSQMLQDVNSNAEKRNSDTKVHVVERSTTSNKKIYFLPGYKEEQ